MKDRIQKSAGLSLIIGSLLMILTMVLHPVGGNFDRLVQLMTVGMIVHSIGLFSIPFMAYGYLGLMYRLEEETFLSKVGFSFMLFGLIAVMLAATLNGLVLMQFVGMYTEASDEVVNSLKPIFRYNHVLNLSNDYIFMTAMGVSTLFWSIAILRTKALPSWLGYFGLVLVASATFFVLTGFVFTSVIGFSFFIFGSAAWTIATGWFLRKT